MSHSEESNQSTESGDNDGYTVETEDGVTIAHQSIVSSTDDGRSRRGAWGRGRWSRWLGGGTRRKNRSPERTIYEDEMTNEEGGVFWEVKQESSSLGCTVIVPLQPSWSLASITEITT